MRFDAYAGNVQGVRPEDVATIVSFASKGRYERGRPRGRYHDVFEVKDGHEGLGWVGHDAILDAAFFEFKGAGTPMCADAIRRHWPDRHTVSRLDAAEDFDEEGCYGRLVGIIDAAADPRVNSHEIRPRNGDRGTTTYWGAASSRVMVRCYEAGKMKDRLHLGRPWWVRTEAQVRPGKSMEKRIAARVTPLEVWGWSAWSRRAAEALCQVEVPRFAAEYSPPEFDKTTLYLARTFRRHFEEMLGDLGSWECVGREVAEIWRQDDEAAKSEALPARNAKHD